MGDSHHIREHRRINNADLQPVKTLEGTSTPASPASPNISIYYNSTTTLVEAVYSDGAITTLSAIPEGRPELANGNLTSYMAPGVMFLGGAVGTYGITVDKINYFPIIVQSSITLDALVLNVATLTVGGLLRMGIYNADRDWQPTSLVVGTGTIDASTTGIKTVSVTNTLSPGRYLMAMTANASITLRSYFAHASFIGLPTTLESGDMFNQFYILSITFAAFPSTGTKWTGTAVTTTGFIYPMFLRVLTP